MTIFEKIILATMFVSISTTVNASQIEIDAGTVNDGLLVGSAQTVTGIDVIDPNNIGTASSTYIDIDDSGTITAGDIFIDQETDIAVGLTDLPGDDAYSETFGTTWELTTDYTLWGIVVDTGGGTLEGGIAGGFLNMYYHDIVGTLAGNDSAGVNDGKRVLNIDLTGSSLTGLNLALDGVVDYSWCGMCSDTFVTEFFNWEAPGQNIDGTDYTKWYDYWEAGLLVNPVITLDVVADTRFEPNSLVDSNPDDGMVTPDAYFSDASYATEKAGFDAFIAAVTPGAPASPIWDTSKAHATSVRSGEELDLSITQKIPEPNTLLIFGLGILGLVTSTRKSLM